MKKKIIIIIFLLLLVVVGMVYFGIGIFASKEEPIHTNESIESSLNISRRFNTPNPYISNQDITYIPDEDTDGVEPSSALLPLVRYEAAEAGLKYEQCLDCEFKRNNPEYCEDNECSKIGQETNRLNYFFCENPYMSGWDSSQLLINDVPSSIPSNLGSENSTYYEIFKCLDKFRKDLVRNNSNCSEMLDKTRTENIDVINDFKNSLPERIRTQLETGIKNPSDSSNGIPITDNSIEDYILYNKYIQFKNDGFRGFRNTYKQELLELEEQYFTPEIDSIYATCFGIHTAPSPSDVVCPIQELLEPPPCEYEEEELCEEIYNNTRPYIVFGDVTPMPPPPTPAVKYAPVGGTCPANKVNDTIELCQDAFEELSEKRINPVVYSNNNFPQGCGLLQGDSIIFNNISTNGNPNPSVAPLCRR